MAYTARFDAKTKKLVIEVDADDAAFAAAPVSNKGEGPNKLLASAGDRVKVNVPGKPVVTVMLNALFPKA